MNDFAPPPIEDILKSFPDISDVSYVNEGGYKYVYKCKIDNEYQALKLARIPKPVSLSENDVDEYIQEVTKRIIREINILGKNKSKYIVKLGTLSPSEIKIGSNNYVSYSEEFISGNNLLELINSNYKPDETELKTLARCLLNAIHEMWNNLKIVHRDIKPLNIIKTNNVKRPFILLDFGLAYSLVDSQLTFNASDRLPPGTLRYIAPEMFNNAFRETIDFRSDLYTSALTVFEFATNKNPFLTGHEDLVNTLSKIIKENPTQLQSLRPDLSLDFCNTINQLLKKLPALRPSNINLLLSKME